MSFKIYNSTLKKIQRFVFLVPCTLLFCETRGFHFTHSQIHVVSNWWSLDHNPMLLD
jgi:hypothetical protein